VSADENISAVTDMIGRHEPKLPQESTPDIVPITSVPDGAQLAAPSSKSRRKSLQVKPPQPPAQLSKPPTPPVASPAPQLKVAWSKEDEAKKSKSSSVAIGIREIQEAESKRAEARKAAERERERAARAAALAPNKESSTFTASWGLPTSQVHSSRNNTSKDPPFGTSPNAATTTAPLVWTSVAKPPVTKKTMNEIQEEEERRKKVEASKEKESVGTVVRRAYAESTNKV
jgi:PERQ amino acid-rich with GYF domain-containing protein